MFIDSVSLFFFMLIPLLQVISIYQFCLSIFFIGFGRLAWTRLGPKFVCVCVGGGRGLGSNLPNLLVTPPRYVKETVAPMNVKFCRVLDTSMNVIKMLKLFVY